MTREAAVDCCDVCPNKKVRTLRLLGGRLLLLWGRGEAWDCQVWEDASTQVADEVGMSRHTQCRHKRPISYRMLCTNPNSCARHTSLQRGGN